MPEKSHASANPSAKKPTPAPIASTPLRGSRWQVLAAGVMLAIWVAFLIAMALYNS
jgi:hypothetical protein